MKEVYITDRIINLNINGEWITKRPIPGRPQYQYGEKPQNYFKLFNNEETVFEDLINILRYVGGVKVYKTFLRKRSYIDLFPFEEGIIYKDSLKEFKINYFYETVKNPIIKYLEEDLGFMGYSELVFDREQELKELIIKE